MKTIIFPVDVKHILAAKIIAPKSDARYYLNAIFFEFEKSGGRMVVTDGHRLAVINLKYDDYRISEPMSFIVPIDYFDHVKTSKSTSPVLVKVNFGDKKDGKNVFAVSVDYSGTTKGGYTTGATYPDWRRIIPRGEPSGISDQYNPLFVADFAKIEQIYAKKSREPRVEIRHDGVTDPNRSGNAAVVDIGVADFFAVLMPTRYMDNTGKHRPTQFPWMDQLVGKVPTPAEEEALV